MTNYFTRIISSILISLCFLSCEKLDYDDGIISFGDVFFNTSNVALHSSLKIHYNGNLIEIQREDGRVRVPEGTAKFEFYDNTTNQLLLEKTVDIVAGNPERITLFQPTADAPLMFLDENSQADEEPAPPGYYKVKFVNYTGSLLPFNKKMNIVMFRAEFNWITFETEYVEIGVLESIGTNLNEETYHLIPVEAGDQGLAFSFREAETGDQLTTVAGNEFLNSTFNQELANASASLSNPKKNVFTAYIEAYEIDYQNDNFLKIHDKLYGIRPVIFLKD